MADFQFKSKQQILSSMVSTILAELGINDLNPGSVTSTILEAAAREDFQQYIQMLNVIRNYNLDTTTGEDLDNRAFEFGLEREDPLKASGSITVKRPASFNKVSTSFYSGKPSPIQGDSRIFVNDASDSEYGSSGTLILGRGTSNEEEVSYSTAPVDQVNFWRFDLDTPLSNNHTLNESVILKQGTDEQIPAGTNVIVPSTGTSPRIVFTTDNDVTLLAGEEELKNVKVTAAETGERGNIPANAISGEDAFDSPPFSGAIATNESKFTTGRDRETDDELRDRIRSRIQSLSKGVERAIRDAIVGLVDSNTAKRVVSANIVLPVKPEDDVTVYIDDGTGFEPTFAKRAKEEIIDQAAGGQTKVQLDLIPLVKAQLETISSEPFDFSGGSFSLNVSVGIDSETITFNTTDFEFPESAKAEEIVRVINDQTRLLEARTSQGGSKLTINAQREQNEDIQVTGGTANSLLNFPTERKSTLYLYKNDKLLSKDGSTAFVDSSSENYDFTTISATGPWPLNVVVDGKTTNSLTVNFNNSDFNDPSAATAEEVRDAINNQIVGAEASVIDDSTKVRMASQTKNSSESKIEVTGGTANSVLRFPTSKKTGSDRDYVMNRFLGTIVLENSLSNNDIITAGSDFTRAFLRAASSENYVVNSGETLVISVDGGSNQTVTFSTSGSLTAQQVADIINSQLSGGTAISRTIGSENFLEIRTNTFSESLGSIRIDSSSTVGISFNTDTTVSNERPHTAFKTSSSSGPYTFLENQKLIVILDNDPAAKTFSVNMDYDGEVTSFTSDTVFTDSDFSTVFQKDNVLKDFYLVFSSGGNTTSGTVTGVSDQGGGTFRYSFGSLPSNLADFSSGDQVIFSGLQNEENNGAFIITTVNTSGSGYVEVTNPDGVAESGSSGSAKIEIRRLISDYDETSGQITLNSPARVAPSVGDTFAVLPQTVQNVIDYFNNIRVTSISIQANIEEVENASKVQISSKLSGSDGYVQVSGGSANDVLNFNTDILQGLQAYIYYQGLVKLVHSTIYGDDRDLASFPGVGAAGIDFDIKAPTIREVSFGINVTIEEGVSLSNLENEIESAVTGYVNSLEVGENVILEEISSRIIQIPNIIDVSITAPTSNITIDEGELARTRGSLITVS